MKPNALIFPEPGCSVRFCSLLAPFFNVVYHYLTYETKTAGPETTAGTSCCRPHIPFALGNDRDRLEHYIRDIKTHASEYYEGFLTSLADRITGGQDELSWKLAAGISKGAEQNRDDEQSAKEKETVFQALLILRLAELLTEEENALEESMADLAEREKKLMEALRGDDFDDELELTISDDPVPHRSLPPKIRIPTLCKAWGQLFLRDTNMPPETILVTRFREGIDLLLDAYERISAGSKQTAITFRLPVLIKEKAGSEPPDSVSEILASAWSMLTETASSGNSNPERLADLLNRAADKWNNSFSTTAQDGTTAALTLYLLPGISTHQLFRNLGRMPAGEPAHPGALAVIAHLDEDR